MIFGGIFIEHAYTFVPLAITVTYLVGIVIIQHELKSIVRKDLN